MNYLAHVALAGPEPAGVLGGIAGDFVKGRIDQHPDSSFANGVRLHRAIDRFTDHHPICARSRARFVGPLSLIHI